MLSAANLARPYARAVFEFARANAEDLAEWNRALDLLARIAGDARLARFAADPRTGAEQLQQTVLATVAAAKRVAAEQLPPPFVNLVKLLIHNRRLSVAGEVARLFAAHRAAAEDRIAARMTTAIELDAAQQQQFTAALRKKLGREVELEFAVDEEIIGGAVVRAGDSVIDASTRAQLSQLQRAIAA